MELHYLTIYSQIKCTFLLQDKSINLPGQDFSKMGRNGYLRVAKSIVRIFSWDPVWWRLIWFPNKCHLLIELSVWARIPAQYVSLSIGKKNQWLLKNHAPAACGMLNTLNCLLIFISEPLDTYKSSCWLLVQIKSSNSTNIKSLTLQPFLRYCACLYVLFGILDLWILLLWRRFSYFANGWRKFGFPRF